MSVSSEDEVVLKVANHGPRVYILGQLVYFTTSLNDSTLATRIAAHLTGHIYIISSLSIKGDPHAQQQWYSLP